MLYVFFIGSTFAVLTTEAHCVTLAPPSAVLTKVAGSK